MNSFDKSTYGGERMKLFKDVHGLGLCTEDEGFFLLLTLIFKS